MRALRYAEAYALMRYRAWGASDVEIIWNSRDGITPFTVAARPPGGEFLTHVEFDRDARMVLHVPAIGDRIFVDQTLDRAREFRERFVATYWERARMDAMYGSRDEAVETLARRDYGDGHQPDLVVVDARLRGALVDRFREITAQMSVLAPLLVGLA